MPTTIGEMDVQMTPPASTQQPAAPAAAGKPAPDRHTISRLLRAEADRTARLHAD